MGERRRLVGRCPACGSELQVTRLECPNCETAVEGWFQTCKFCLLSPEQRDFLETFVRVRGNIREVERELGISYPTVRGRLDRIIRALGYDIPENEGGPGAGKADERRKESRHRKEVLARLARGEVTAEEAVRLLKQPG